MISKLTLTLASLCLVFALVGCGASTPELGSVTGTVKIDGNPTPDLEVTFVPEGGGIGSSGKTDASGNYELLYDGRAKGAILGSHLVRISSAAGGGEAGGEAAVAPIDIPPSYNTESTIKKSVAAGTNKFDFEIETK
jgi:hypothetical protein